MPKTSLQMCFLLWYFKYLGFVRECIKALLSWHIYHVYLAILYYNESFLSRPISYESVIKTRCRSVLTSWFYFVITSIDLFLRKNYTTLHLSTSLWYNCSAGGCLLFHKPLKKYFFFLLWYTHPISYSAPTVPWKSTRLPRSGLHFARLACLLSWQLKKQKDCSILRRTESTLSIELKLAI